MNSRTLSTFEVDALERLNLTAPTVTLAGDAEIVGYVFETDALWFRGRGGAWHLLRVQDWRSVCGREMRASHMTRQHHITWPWPAESCFSCMDRRWAGGIR
jgi:hypothetical protein